MGNCAVQITFSANFVTAFCIILSWFNSFLVNSPTALCLCSFHILSLCSCLVCLYCHIKGHWKLEKALVLLNNPESFYTAVAKHNSGCEITYSLWITQHCVCLCVCMLALGWWKTSYSSQRPMCHHLNWNDEIFIRQWNWWTDSYLRGLLQLDALRRITF